MTQPANVNLVVGNLTSMKTAAKLIKKYQAAKDFALESGSTLSSVTHETQLSEGVAPTSLAGRMLGPHGAVEVHNRLFASLAGAEHAVQMFKKLKQNPNSPYARRQLSHWLGLDPDVLVNQQKLTMDQVRTAAHTLSDRTQFRTSALELPYGWKAGLANRMATLFKSYAFNQGKFLKEAIGGELKRGNIRPLLPLLTTIPILGTLADRTKRALTYRDQPAEFWDTVIGAYSMVGGLGLIQDVATRTMAGAFAEWVGGPGVGDVSEAVDSVIKDMRQSNAKRASTRAKAGTHTKRFLTRQIPVVGRPLSNYLYPYEARK
jgi:hypothetical protein